MIFFFTMAEKKLTVLSKIYGANNFKRLAGFKVNIMQME